MSILPTRPLRLDAKHLARLRRQALGVTLLLVGVGGGFLTGCFFFTRQVLAERALWQRGTPGEVQEVSGTVTETSKLGLTFLYEYELDVAYLDAAGGAHQGKSEFDLFWSPLPDDERTPELRYDPTDPEHFVLSSPIEAGLSRWGLALMMGGLGALMLGGLVSTVRTQSARRRAFELCAIDGEEILAPLQGVTREQKNVRVKFALPDRAKPADALLSAEPLVVEVASAPHVVVLRSPRDRECHVVLQADLAPFAFDPATTDAILKRAAEPR